MISAIDEQLERAITEPDFVHAMRRGLAKFHHYRDAVPFVPYAYTRTLLEKTDAYELVIMQWAPGSLSSVHDHGDSSCWAAVIEGTLDVENFQRLEDVLNGRATILAQSSVRLHAGELDLRSGPKELHRVRNTAEGEAFSLQLYAAPLTTYNVIEERSGRCITAKAQYDSIIDLTSF